MEVGSEAAFMHASTDAHDPSTKPAVAIAICDPTRALFFISAISKVGVKEFTRKNHICCLSIKNSQ